MIHLQCRIKTIMPADQVGEGHTCMPLLHVRQHTHIEPDTYVCKVSTSTHRNISIIASRLSAAARHTHIIIILSRASLSLAHSHIFHSPPHRHLAISRARSGRATPTSSLPPDASCENEHTHLRRQHTPSIFPGLVTPSHTQSAAHHVVLRGHRLHRRCS